MRILESTLCRETSLESLIYDLEFKGYCVIDNAIDRQTLYSLREEVEQLEQCYSSASLSQQNLVVNESRFMMHELQFESCCNIHRLIVDNKAVAVIAAAMGDDLVCTGSTYAHCKPGYPGIPLHTDSDPYGTNTYRPSNPVSVRVVYYLDDLTVQKSPLRVVPYSHLSLHKSRRPDIETFEKMEGEITITCAPGTAVIMNTKLFHGVYANKSNTGRRVLAISYRPRWAGPIKEVKEHSKEKLELLPEKLKSMFTFINESTPLERKI